MVHLPIAKNIRSSKKIEMETYIIMGLVGASCLLFLTAFSHHHNSNNATVVAAKYAPASKGTSQTQNRKLAAVAKPNQRALGPIFKLIHTAPKASPKLYTVNLETPSLDSYMPDKNFPTAVKVTVDGKAALYKPGYPHSLSLHLRLFPGKHTVTLSMWDKKNRVTNKQLLVSAGPILSYSYKVAQNDRR